jgi:hypothetical protein
MTGGGKPLPKLTTPGSAGDVLAGKQLIDQYGNPLTGTIQSLGEKTYSPSASEQRISAGQYLSGAQIIKALPALSDPGSAGAMLKGKQLIDQDGNVVEGTIPTVEAATPKITIDSNGKILAKTSQDYGFVAAANKSATYQMTTLGAQTYTPGTSDIWIIDPDTFVTGVQILAGDSNLVASNIVSGVSIFGVAGSYVRSVGSAVTLTIVNNTSRAVGIFWIDATSLEWYSGGPQSYSSGKYTFIGHICFVSSTATTWAASDCTVQTSWGSDDKTLRPVTFARNVTTATLTLS